MKRSQALHSRISARTILLLAAAAAIFTAPCRSDAYCGDANNDSTVTALDALVVLRASVGTGDACDGNCDCDVDFNREITANDALGTLRAAVQNDLYSGCGFEDGCFYDEDCEEGYYCGTHPEWECDAACVPE